MTGEDRLVHRSGPLSAERIGRFILLAGAVALLALWLGTWAASLADNHLAGGPRFFWRFDYLGYDFERSYRAAADWLSGRDPYAAFNDGAGIERYNHPPLVIWLFAWATVLSFRTATAIWIVAVAAMACLCVWLALRARAELGLSRLPFLPVLALFLWSTPVLFAMERGNWDFPVALLVLASMRAVSRSATLNNIFVGAALAVATWIKLVPAILILGLAAARRWRLAAAVVAGIVLIALADLAGVQAFFRNMRESVVLHAPDLTRLYYGHSLTASWPILWADTPLAGLARIPGELAAAGLILPLIVVLTDRLRRCPDATRMLAPYSFWLMAATSFLLPIAYDYKLIFLLLTVVLTWDRRDPVIVHVLIGLLLIHAQPFRLDLEPRLIFLVKLAGLGGVTISLARRLATPGLAAATNLRRWKS